MELLLESFNKIIDIIYEDKEKEFWYSIRVQDLLKTNINNCIAKHNLFNFKHIDRRKRYKDFCKKMRPVIKDEFNKNTKSKIKSCVINKKLGEMWRNMDDTEKEKYVEDDDNTV
jgi:hypothetical protein